MHLLQPLAFSSYAVQSPYMALSELWQRLRQARRFADLTQADLASRCGVSRGAVALWEAAEPEHRTRPTTDHIVTIAKVCNVPLEWLLNDTSDINALWRLSGEFGPAPTPAPNGHTLVNGNGNGDVLPDLRQGGHLFVFAHAQQPAQVVAKLAQLANEPSTLRKHLILIGTDADISTVDTPTDALAQVVHMLTTQKPPVAE